jgi:hypothetical protein
LGCCRIPRLKSTPRGLGDLEAAVECLPRPRQWAPEADYITGGNAGVLARR